MNDTIPIQELSETGIGTALRRALESATPVRDLCDFVSRVDWSGFEMADPKVTALLGDLEQLTTDLTEDVLEASDFLNRVGQLFVLTMLSDGFAVSPPANSSATRAVTTRRIGGGRETERIMLYA